MLNNKRKCVIHEITTVKNLKTLGNIKKKKMGTIEVGKKLS